MSTTPVTPVKETEAQKIQSFFTKFGQDLEKVINAVVNVAQKEEPAVATLLPPAIQAEVAKVINAAAQQVAAADAKYAAIGKSDIPFAAKVAEAVAVGGEGVIAIAAQSGLAFYGNLNEFFAASAVVAQSLNLANITAPPASTEQAAASSGPGGNDPPPPAA